MRHPRLTVALLLCVIVLAFSFSFLRYQANNGQPNDWFNTHWRTTFAQSHAMRWLLNLHLDGDARSDYLHIPSGQTLQLTVYADATVQVPSAALDEAAAAIGSLLGIPSRVTVSAVGSITKSFPTYTLEDIRGLGRSGSHVARSGPTISVYLLTTYADQPSNIGLSVRDDGVAIFLSAIRSLADQNTAAVDPLMLSTILHEVGHQVGLMHVDDIACIMAPSVEQPNATLHDLLAIPRDYCPQERAQIAALQQAKQK